MKYIHLFLFITVVCIFGVLILTHPSLNEVLEWMKNTEVFWNPVEPNVGLLYWLTFLFRCDFPGLK